VGDKNTWRWRSSHINEHLSKVEAMYESIRRISCLSALTVPALLSLSLTLSLTFSLNLTFSLDAHSAELHSPDEFEISGIRTGMKYEEAIEKLSQYYSINVDDFEINRFIGKVPFFDYENPPNNVVYSGENVWFEIVLHPELVENQDTAYMVVEEIRINPQTGSRDDRIQLRAAMREELIQQYGQPTLSRINDELPGRSEYFWCESKPTKKFGCNRRESFASVSVRGLTIVNAKVAQAFLDARGARSETQRR